MPVVDGSLVTGGGASTSGILLEVSPAAEESSFVEGGGDATSGILLQSSVEEVGDSQVEGGGDGVTTGARIRLASHTEPVGHPVPIYVTVLGSINTGSGTAFSDTVTQKVLGVATTVSTAQRILGFVKTLGIVTTVNSARPLTVTKPIRKTLGIASTTSTARSFGADIFRSLTLASESDSAQTLVKNRAVNITRAINNNIASSSISGTDFNAVNPVTTVNTAVALSYRKRIHVSTTIMHAQALSYEKNYIRTVVVVN